VDYDGEIIDDPTGLGVNRTGFVIHSAILRMLDKTDPSYKT